MSQISQQVRFISSRAPVEIMGIAEQVLSKLGGKLSRQQDCVFTDLGSQLKMRLLGGMFLSNESLPTRVKVEVLDGGEERRIFVSAEDLTGFGTTAGLGSRYQAWCTQLAERVHDDLAYQLENLRKNAR